MKLNADIICRELSEVTKIRCYGQTVDELTLGRPRLCGPHQSFEVGCVYIAGKDVLPAEPPCPAPPLTICIGGDPPPAWLRDDMPMLITDETAELINIFNITQGLFDRYERWDMEMRDILEDSASITQMVILSSPLFDNTITVIDKNLHLLARNEPNTLEDGSYLWKTYTAHDAIPPYAAALMQDLYWGYRSQTVPFLHDDKGRYGGTWVYSVNLIIEGRYEGCASLSAKIHPFRAGDQALYRYFSLYVRKALEKNLSAMITQAESPRAVLKDLLDSLPVDERRLEQILESLGRGRRVQRWQCLRLQPTEQPQSFPVDYLRSSIKKILPDCVSLVYDKGIVVLLHYDEDQTELSAILNTFLSRMMLKAGISYPFFDFRKLRVFYRQACCALDNGAVMDPQKLVYRFADQSLGYLLSLCIGEFTPMELLPPGLAALAELTRQTSVNYWQTLQAYLDNEMNATVTAKKLYLHRSTMLQRLNRIYSVIRNDLDDPASRLYYRICFYIIEQYGGLEKN